MSYDHFLGRNLYIYMSKRPKSQRRAFPLSFLSSDLVQVLLGLVEGIGTNKTAQAMDISTPRYSEARFSSSLLSPLLPGSYLALVERIWNEQDCASRLRHRGIAPISEGLVFCSHFIVILCSWLLFLHCAATDFSFERRN